MRRAGNEEVLVAINFSNRPFFGSVEVANATSIDGGGLPVLSLDAWGYRIFKRRITQMTRIVLVIAIVSQYRDGAGSGRSLAHSGEEWIRNVCGADIEGLVYAREWRDDGSVLSDAGCS